MTNLQTWHDTRSAARLQHPASAVLAVVDGMGGRALDAPIRAEMEARLDADFSSVRVHTGEAAAAAAAAVQARAYTVGNDVVFGAGAFAVGTAEGRRTLAHELVHVQQQRRGPVAGTSIGGGIAVSEPGDSFERDADARADRALRGPVPALAVSPARLGGDGAAAIAGGRTVARVCLPAAKCAAPPPSLTNFVQQTEADPVNKSKGTKRAADCAAHKPACTSDGHAAVATALTAFLKDRSPSRLDFVSGLFVNKDMPASWGAVTVGCAGFTPPLPVSAGKAFCTTVPDSMEAEAKQYMNTQAAVIGGVDRYTWVTRTLMTLTHETEHGRFDTATQAPATSPLKGPAAGSCTPADVEDDLSEMAAQMAEFPILLRRIQILPDAVRAQKLASWFQYHLNNGGEDVTGTLTAMRCKCECSEVDAYIKQVAGFAQAGWNSFEKFTYNTEMKKPVHALNWPVDPPAAVDVNDLPSSPATVEPKDLPDIAKKVAPSH